MGLSLPLFLTLARLSSPLVIFPLIVLGGGSNQYFATGVFALAAISDWADGALSRYLGHATRWGRVLDPIADKMLCLMTLLALALVSEPTPMFTTVLFLMFARELIMAGLREGLTGKNDLPVSPLSRVKTLLTYFGIGFLVLGDVTMTPGLVLLAAALTLGYISLIRHVWRAFGP